VALEVTRQFSPTDVARLGPHKYFLAEVYSGANQETMKEKVTQLETLCEFLVGRWSDQHDDLPPVTDVTSVVGAAALVFSTGDAPRLQVLNTAIDLVVARVSRVGSECKGLKRLCCAGRLLIIVLDKSQSPITFFQRIVASELAGVRHGMGLLQPIPEELAGVRSDIKALLDRHSR
jgi:hypothetical protein